MDKSVILILQSKTTGRFLLKSRNSEWKWPGVVSMKSDAGWLFLALEQASYEVGFDLNDENSTSHVTLDFLIGYQAHQVFHIWLEGEPCTGVNNKWVALFDFPEDTHECVDMVVDNQMFLEKIISPD